MASSRRPAPDTGASAVVDTLVGWLAGPAAGRRILVAVSGGLDSMVLLDALAGLVPPERLHVGHVDHALQPGSGRWARFVAERARAIGVDATSRRLDGMPAAGDSVEAWARRARYAALDRIAMDAGCDLVSCAHHADDQVETLLIALGRGAGPRGLAAMASAHPAERGLHRPLLALPRIALEAHARARGLEFVQDPSNGDCRFARNALRHQALPALEAAMPGFRVGAMRAIGHLAEARALLAGIAAEELDRLVDADGRLDARGLAGLSDARHALVLRAWVDGQGLPAPSAARLADWRRQLGAAGAPPLRLPHAGAWLCRYRDSVWIERGGIDATPGEIRWHWQGEPDLALPDHDARLRIVPGGPLPADWLRSRPLLVRRARAGDRLRTVAGRPSRTLKNLWQERAVPPWLRTGLPVVEIDGRVVYAAGFGCNVDGNAVAASGGGGSAGVGLRFEPRAADDPRRRFLCAGPDAS